MTPATNAARDEAARALGAIVGGQSIDWEHVLHRRSFLELDALARAEALVDDGTIRVLSGPFERLESPWLQPQDVTPQSDDGVVIARGTIGGTAVVIASIEQEFQGGGIGEVSGAKITQALRLAAATAVRAYPSRRSCCWRPAVSVCRRRIWGSTRSPRSALRCSSCARSPP